jgi:hypothetical protein
MKFYFWATLIFIFNATTHLAHFALPLPDKPTDGKIKRAKFPNTHKNAGNNFDN